MEYRMRGLWTYRNSMLYSLSELLHPRNQGNCQASPQIYRDELDHPPIRCQETLLAQRQTKEYHGGPRQVDQRSPWKNLNVYVLKYTSISEALVTAHALSSLDRVARLLDGLSEDLRRKVVRHCTKQGWKLSTQDSGTADPEYDAIKSFILTEAQTNQTMAVYDSERSLRERTSTSIGDALHQDTSS